MTTIASIKAIEILDSRGNPTLEVCVTTTQGIQGKASVPSGASTGLFEACELRDADPKRYFGKGVQKAISHVNGPLAKLLLGKSVTQQESLDRLMIQEEGTENKSHFGANALLGISMAIARAGAKTAALPLYRYLGGTHACLLPCPMMNILNGGAHGDNGLNFQEFMIRPIGAPTFKEAVRFGAEVFHTLKTILKEKGLSTAVGDEGGFSPQIDSNEQALELILAAIEKAGYKPGSQITLALDCAASEFYDSSCQMYLEKKQKLKNLPFKKRTKEEHVAYLAALCKKYPIDSIEDGFDQEDWEGWKMLTKTLDPLQIVGDDLFVTHPKFLLKGIKEKAANSILIKPNQIGTITETLETLHLAKTHGFKTIISHRSGETEDTFIADLSVASQAGQIKTGSLSRTDRIAKYNRLLSIEEDLGKAAQFSLTPSHQLSK